MRALLAAMLIVALAFAGCASNDPKDDDATPDEGSTSASPGPASTSSGSASGTTSTTGTGTDAPNQPPTATLTANVTEGSAPLSVNFTVNGTDADGDSLRWSLAYGDGSLDASGSAVPANEVHAFTVAGTYLVQLNLTDGNATARANVTITVTAAATGEPVSIALATILPCTDCYFSPAATGQCVEFLTGEPKGLRCDWGELPADAAGRDFLLAGGSDPGLEFYSSCDGASAESLGAQDETAATEVGTVPAGALCVVVYEFEEPGASFTFTVA